MPALTKKKDAVRALHDLYLSLDNTGEVRRAIQLARRAVIVSQYLRSFVNLIQYMSELAVVLRDTGELDESEVFWRRALKVNRELEDELGESFDLLYFGSLLTTMGRADLGRFALERCRRRFIKKDNPRWEGIAAAELTELVLQTCNFDAARTWSNLAWKLAGIERVERDVIRAASCQGRVALAVGEITSADERLHHALTRARAVNLVELELRALIALAELALKCKNPVEARARLDDVWEAAERGPYPLQQAEALNVLAATALLEGDKPAAIDAATKAYKAAWCDGPPYAYYWGLQKAKAHLTAVGAPEPYMPPFGESKFEPLPEVEINPRDEYWVDPDKLD